MLNENQRKWVEALRSGEFKQSIATLQTDVGYCCLGVACVVAERNGVQVLKRDDGNLLGGSLNTQPHVKAWLGIKECNGEHRVREKGRFYHSSLVTLNDNKGYTFEQIADHIEQNAEGIFNAN
jgi:hypothetical protein